LLVSRENIIFAKEKLQRMEQTIDTYRLTSLEEPSDEILSQLMREAAEEARQRYEAATKKYFQKMRAEAQKIAANGCSEDI